MSFEGPRLPDRRRLRPELSWADPVILDDALCREQDHRDSNQSRVASGGQPRGAEWHLMFPMRSPQPQLWRE